MHRIGGTAATIMETGNHTILVSYSTPVAAFNRKTGILTRTDRHYSKTTECHIGKFCRGYPGVHVFEVPDATWKRNMEMKISIGKGD